MITCIIYHYNIILVLYLYMTIVNCYNGLRDSLASMCDIMKKTVNIINTLGIIIYLYLCILLLKTISFTTTIQYFEIVFSSPRHSFTYGHMSKLMVYRNISTVVLITMIFMLLFICYLYYYHYNINQYLNI